MLVQRFRAELYLPSTQMCLRRDTTERAFPLLPCTHPGNRQIWFSCRHSLHQVQLVSAGQTWPRGQFPPAHPIFCHGYTIGESGSDSKCHYSTSKARQLNHLTALHTQQRQCLVSIRDISWTISSPTDPKTSSHTMLPLMLLSCLSCSQASQGN